MPARLLLEIAMRVLGLWLVVAAISTLSGILFYVWPGASNDLFWPSGSRWGLIIASATPHAIYALLGALLIWRAPRLATRFYPADCDEAPLQLNVGPGDVYRVACFILGVWFLVQAAQPGAQAAVALIAGDSWRSTTAIVETVVTLIHVAAGLLLVFGSRPIAALLANLRYDPDTIPRQQISLAVLLAVILLVGLALGAIRWSVVGGR